MSVSGIDTNYTPLCLLALFTPIDPKSVSVKLVSKECQTHFTPVLHFG